jgi:hypothetical protein
VINPQRNHCGGGKEEIIKEETVEQYFLERKN